MAKRGRSREQEEPLTITSLRKGARINGRYEVKGKIGQGWEGITYLVRDRLDGRLKGLKFITNMRRRKSIVAQARVLVRLHHPNIINYYTVDRYEADGESHLFLLVEYLQGPRLAEMIRRQFKSRKGPSLFQNLRIFYQICRGMAYVHDQQILHDDLHAENIILTGDPEAPVAKLFDFWGSRGARGVDRRAFDLRCAGDVLFELMTGRTEYKPARLSRLPREVADILRRTHARVHTYRNFHEILADLDALRDWD